MKREELKEKETRFRTVVMRWTMAFILSFTIIDSVHGQDDIDLSSLADTSSNHQSPITNHQSKRKAILLSLAVPGLGEAYVGSWDRARAFFITEGLTWTGFTALRVYSGWRADDYRVYSAEHAGVTLAGQSDAFFRDIGSFSSSEVFNTQQLLTQRERARIYTGASTWVWNNDTSRETYLNIRRSSRRAGVRSVYLIGFAIVTRIVSAIDVARIVDSRSPALPALNMHLPPDGSIHIVLGYRF